MAGLVEIWSEALGTIRLGRVLDMFPDVSDEVSAQKKHAYLIRYEMYCCLPLRKPQDPASVFSFLSLRGQLTKFTTAERFSSAEEAEEEGSLAWHFRGWVPFPPQQPHRQKLSLLFSSCPRSTEI